MDGSTGGRSGRRNDSISSVMSFTAENSTWSRQNEDCNTAPAIPRDSQGSSHASISTRHHAHNQDDGSHMLSQNNHDSLSSADTSLSTSEDSIHLSETDIRYNLYHILEQAADYDDMDLVTSYQRAPPLPPVTQDSLGELDVSRIVNNPKLRHDVNFDRELHFRPNLDGHRGKQKLRDADEYWKALIAELELYRSVGLRLMACESAEDLEHWSRMMEGSQNRIPGMFETIKGVLRTLVPERDQARVDERLDVPMIMQQITKGVFNLMDLAQWLAALLKAHCAPMRDSWIDQMVQQIRRGVDEGCQKRIVIGLRQTLGILEAMKLDVANHQIRHLRGLLIDDTVNFQQKYHLHRMNYGRLDPTRARAWFRREEMNLMASSLSPTPLETFTSATLRSLLSQNSASTFPETFHLDTERLRTLRSDLHNIIQFDICCDALDVLAQGKLSGHAREAAKDALKTTVSDIVGESRRFVENAGNIAAEIVRMVLQLEGSATCYNTDMVDFVERQLRADLEISSVAFSARIQVMLEEQLPRFCNAVKTSSRLSLVALHDAMLPRTQPTGNGLKPVVQAPQSQQEQPIDDILRRSTHLAVLHWHIWSPLVYNIQEDGTFSRPGSSGSTSGAAQITSGPAASASLALNPQTQSQSTGFPNQPSGSSIVSDHPQK